jgi:hypothetical protein
VSDELWTVVDVTAEGERFSERGQDAAFESKNEECGDNED